MNNHYSMNTVHKSKVDPSLASLPEAEFPSHLHGQIMKRVFFAGYGKYLYLSTGVLFLNLGVLGRELWRTLKSMSFDASFITDAVPLHAFILLGVTAAATVYAFHMIWRLYREYRVFAFAR
jgi:hypothetical protein